MDRTQQIAAAFNRLLSTYDRNEAGSPEDVARRRVERAAAYFEAVEPYDTQDVLSAIRNLGNGSAPGHNPSYVPPAPVVGAECRRVMNLRLDSERRLAKPILPAPPKVSGEKRREMADRLAALAAELRLNGDAA